MIYGAERAIRGIFSLHANRLLAQINDIEAELGDGTILPRPDKAFVENREIGLANVFQFEVYEQGSVTYPLAEHEVFHKTGSLTSDTPVVVECVMGNNENVPQEIMTKYARLISAAILRVYSLYGGSRTEMEKYGIEYVYPTGSQIVETNENPAICLVSAIVRMHESNDSSALGSQDLVNNAWHRTSENFIVFANSPNP